MWKKGDFCGSDCGWMLVSDSLLWILWKLLICWDLPTRPWSKRMKIFLLQKMVKLLQTNLKATITQIMNSLQQRRRKGTINPQHIRPMSRWFTAAGDLNGFYLYQQRTGNVGYSSHGFTKPGRSIAWSDESQFLQQHSDGRVRMWCKQHEACKDCVVPSRGMFPTPC